MLNRVEILKKLIAAQNDIVPESAEDEGAAEYYSEIQHVIDAITDERKSDQQIIEAASYVGINLYTGR